MFLSKTRTRICLLASIAALVAILFLPTLLLRTPLRSWLIGGVLAREGFDVQIDEVRAGWVTPLRIRQASIGPIGKSKLLAVSEVRSDRTLLSALFHGVEVGKLELDEPKIHVHIDEDGSNLDFPRLGEETEVDDQAVFPDGPDIVEKQLAVTVKDAGVWFKNSDIDRELAVFDGLDVIGTIRQFGGRQTLTIEPGRCLRDAPVTMEMCHSLLKYFVPVLADTTWVQGSLSLELNDCTIDLDRPEDSQLTGRLYIHGIQAGAKNELLAMAGSRIAKLFGRDGFDTIHLADDATVEFQVRDGGVWHEGLAFGLPKVSPDLVVKTSGRVGFDESLELSIEVPLPLHLLSDGPVAAAMRDKPIVLNARGTMDSPEIDMAEEDFMKNLLSQIGVRLAEEDRPLQSIFEGIRDAVDTVDSTLETPLLDRLRERRRRRRRLKP